MSGEGDGAERRDKLHREGVSLRARELRALLDLVAELRELIAVWTKARHEFICLVAGERIGTDVAEARGDVPTGAQHAANFGISGVLVERGDQAIIHLKPLPLSVHIPWTAPPLRIDAGRGARQVAGRRLA